MFGELEGMMCFVFIEFFMFNDMGVMCQEVSGFQSVMQGWFIKLQSFRDIVFNCICLVGQIVVFNGCVNVKFVFNVGNGEWLCQDYLQYWMCEIFVYWFVVDFDFVGIWFDLNVGNCIFMFVGCIRMVQFVMNRFMWGQFDYSSVFISYGVQFFEGIYLISYDQFRVFLEFMDFIFSIFGVCVLCGCLELVQICRLVMIWWDRWLSGSMCLIVVVIMCFGYLFFSSLFVVWDLMLSGWLVCQ